MNKVILIGNLGKDPEIKQTNNGVDFAKCSLATSEKYKDKNGELQSATEWHNIVAYKNQSKGFKYVFKGDTIAVEGKISTRSWEDQNTGEKKYMTEIVVIRMEILKTKTNATVNQPVSANSNSFNEPLKQEAHGDGLPF